LATEGRSHAHARADDFRVGLDERSPVAHSHARPMSANRTARLFSVFVPAIVFAAVLVTSTVYSIRHPFQNFDVLGYVAAALHMEGLRGTELLEGTRTELGEGIHEERKRALMVTGQSPYHKALMSDPRALEQQVPLYAPRVMYIGGIVALHALGLSRVEASSLISVLSVAALAALGWWYVARRFGAWTATFVACAFGYGLRLDFLGELSTADALGALFAIVGSMAVLRALEDKRALALGAACLAFAVATRHDLLLHCALFVPVALWSTRGARSLKDTAIAAAIVLVPSAIVYALLAVTTGWYGRETVIAFSFVEPQPYPLETPLPDVWPFFWDTFFMELREWREHPLIQREVWPIYAAILAWWFARPGARALLAVGVLEIVIRFCLFPVAGPGWQRLYMTTIVLTLWFALEALLERARATEHGRKLLSSA